MRPTGQQGFILIIVVVALIALSALALLLTNSTSLDRALLENQRDSDALDYIVEAGMQHAQWLLNQNSSCSAYTDLPVTAYGNHSYSASITPTSASPVAILATGTLASGANRVLAQENVKAFQPERVVILQPDAVDGKDTYIWAWEGNLNYGSADETWVSEKPGNFNKSVALFEFDLPVISVEATIKSAVLSVMHRDGNDTDVPITAHRVTSAWNEDFATWNERDDGIGWGVSGGDYDPRVIHQTLVGPGINQRYEWDLTRLVTDWTQGGVDNYGVALATKLFGTFGERFDTSDHADPTRHPKLSIIYACECGASGTSASTVLQPGAEGKDSYSNSFGSRSTASYGGDNVITVAESSAKHGLLEFDLSTIPVGAVISNADLEIYLESGGNTGSTLSAYRLTQSWLEGTTSAPSASTDGASWDSYDAVSSWGTSGGDYDPTPASQATMASSGSWHSMDLSVLVAGWVDGSNPNYGLLLQAGTGFGSASFTSSDGANPSLWPKLTIDYNCPCGVECTPPITYNLLFVVPDATTLGTQDSIRMALMESWGFGVVLITAADGQADYDAAVASADVVYISEEVASGDVASKLRNATIGVVSEETALTDEFGISSSHTGYNSTVIEVVEVNHYITSVFATGPLSITTSATALDRRSGILAPGLDDLAATAGNPSLATLDAGAQLYDGGTAAGRRVQLPWGTDDFDINLLSANGQMLMRRAIEWGAGEGYGGVLDPGYTEVYQPWSATSSNSWEAIDLAPFGVPPNAVVEVAVVNKRANFEYAGGVRAVGSILDRRLTLHEAEMGGVDVMILTVQADSASRIEYYAENSANISFILLGYWGSGTFVERWEPFKAGASGSWQDVSLSVYGVAPSSVTEILLANNFASNDIVAGARGDGSILPRQFTIHEPEGGGLDMLTLLVNAGGDAGATIEAYASVNSPIDFYLTGYWTVPPGSFTEAYDTLAAPGVGNNWQDRDLTAFAVPANAVAQIAIANGEDSAENKLGVRQIGSSLQREFDLQEAEAGGDDFAGMHVNVDASSKIQLYEENTGLDHRFYLLGWWVLNP